MQTTLLRAAVLLATALAASAQPVITLQPSPANHLVSRGTALTNRVSATTTNPPLAYQWRFNGGVLPEATNATLVLTNVQLHQAGNYVCRVADATHTTDSQPWLVEVDDLFTKVASGPVASNGSCTAVAWGDFNEDGFLDLFISPFNRSSLLCSNNGDGTFSRVLTGSIATDSGSTFGACWGDYDNDGRLDLFVGVNNGGNDWLYRNNGDGSFTRITSGPVGTSGGNANNCGWGDYDNDGFLDLFVANSDQNDFLFRNNGDTTFTRITNNAIALTPGNSQGGAWGDYDQDGRLDLFVSRVNQPNLLYHNLGGGMFVPVTNDAIVGDVAVGQGTSWGDYDNNGFLDMFVADPTSGSVNLLYRNNGDGTFAKVTIGAIVNDVAVSSSGEWGDYDNDGWLDLFVANRSGSNFLYQNQGDGTFRRITNRVVTHDTGSAFSAAWGDYDNNGFLDLAVTFFRNGNNALYRNDGNSNAWLTVKCDGRRSNRAAIGTKVRVQAWIGGREVWQLREISGGGGLGSQSDLRPHFGLGDATNAATVRLEWPSGIFQELHDVPVRQFLMVTEPAALVTPASQTVAAGATATFTVSPAPDIATAVQWRHRGVPIPNATNALLVISNVSAAHMGEYAVTLREAAARMETSLPAATLLGPVLAESTTPTLYARAGSNATFRINARGAPPLTYQWWHGEQPVPGATDAAFTLTNVQPADGGDYHVVVSNSFGPVSFPAGHLVVLVRPSLTLQPVSQSVPAGGSVTFSVTAEGHPLPLTFRWRRNGQLLTNLTVHDTNCFFTVTNVQPTATTNQFHFSVGVTNLAGSSFVSSNAVLTVLPDGDADGLPDEWETAHGLSAASADDARLDTDGDGLSNAQEYLAGTDPNDPESCLTIEHIACPGSAEWTLRFLAVSNRTYAVQGRGGFGAGGWSGLADVPAAPTNRLLEIRGQSAEDIDRRFFRLVTPRPQ